MFLKLFSNYTLTMKFFGKRIFAQKLLVKFWWNLGSISSTFYVHILQKRSQMHKNDSQVVNLFYDFGIYELKSCSLNVGEICHRWWGVRVPNHVTANVWPRWRSSSGPMAAAGPTSSTRRTHPTTEMMRKKITKPVENFASLRSEASSSALSSGGNFKEPLNNRPQKMFKKSFWKRTIKNCCWIRLKPVNLPSPKKLGHKTFFFETTLFFWTIVIWPTVIEFG